MEGLPECCDIFVIELFSLHLSDVALESFTSGLLEDTSVHRCFEVRFVLAGVVGKERLESAAEESVAAWGRFRTQFTHFICFILYRH
jgi:hypothetical protein